MLRGHTGVAEALLRAGGPALLFAKDMLCCTPVHLAAMQGQMQNQVRAAAPDHGDALGHDVVQRGARRRRRGPATLAAKAPPPSPCRRRCGQPVRR